MLAGQLSLNPRARAPLFIGSAMVAAYCFNQPAEPPIIFALAGLVMGLVSGWSRSKGLRAALAKSTTLEEQPGERRSRSIFWGGMLGLVMGGLLRSPEPAFALGAGVGALVWARELLSLSALGDWAREGMTMELDTEEEPTNSEPKDDEGEDA